MLRLMIEKSATSTKQMQRILKVHKVTGVTAKELMEHRRGLPSGMLNKIPHNVREILGFKTHYAKIPHGLSDKHKIIHETIDYHDPFTLHGWGKGSLLSGGSVEQNQKKLIAYKDRKADILGAKTNLLAQSGRHGKRTKGKDHHLTSFIPDVDDFHTGVHQDIGYKGYTRFIGGEHGQDIHASQDTPHFVTGLPDVAHGYTTNKYFPGSQSHIDIYDLNKADYQTNWMPEDPHWSEHHPEPGAHWMNLDEHEQSQEINKIREGLTEIPQRDNDQARHAMYEKILDRGSAKKSMVGQLKVLPEQIGGKTKVQQVKGTFNPLQHDYGASGDLLNLENHDYAGTYDELADHFQQSDNKLKGLKKVRYN